MKTLLFIGTNETFNFLKQLHQVKWEYDANTDHIGTLSDRPSIAACVIEIQDLNILSKIKSMFNFPVALVSRVPLKAVNMKMMKQNYHIFPLLELPLTKEKADAFIQYLSDINNPANLPPGISSNLLNRYVDSIFDKLELLESYITELKETRSKEALLNLKKEVHKIAGSAGSYGYFTGGQISKEMEKLITPALDKEIDPQLIESLDKLFTELKFYLQIPTKEQAKPLAKTSEIESILLISDDNDVNYIFKNRAFDPWVTIDIERDPFKAVEKLKNGEFKPTVILIEDFFPMTNTLGVDIVKHIKEKVPGANTRFGLITSKDDLSKNIEATQLGFQYILKKPLSFKALTSFLKTFEKKYFLKAFKVLAVDDDPDICLLIKTNLSELGVKVQTTSDERKILEILHEFRPNLLLLDINMPNYDGWSLLRTLRKDIRYKDLKVIVITAFFDPQILKTVQTLGFDEILQKPLDKVQLQYKISEIAQATYKRRTQENESLMLYDEVEFRSQLQKFLEYHSEQQASYYLVILGISNYQEIMQQGVGAEEDFVVVSENLMNRLISKDFLRGYLGYGKFAFLFIGIKLPELEFKMRHFLRESEFKVIMDPKEDRYAFFSCAILSFLSKNDDADIVLDSVNKAFDENVKKSLDFSVKTLEEETNKEKDTVILVDDDTDLTKILEHTFNIRNFNVRVCNSGKAALELFSNPEDVSGRCLVILDRNLEDMDGVDLLKKIKQKFSKKFVVIFLSSRSTEADIIEGLTEGAVDYITKPFSIPVLIKKSYYLINR